MNPPKPTYDNRAAVANSDLLLHEFSERSQSVYRKRQVEKNISYGGGPRETLDWFFAPQPGGDTLIFIHGGYWQACAKEEYAFIADTPLTQGIDTVLVEYALAPDVSLSTICRQVGTALDFIQERLASLKRPGKVFVAGHSAGAHLGAYWHNHPVVSANFAISGIYDLAPLVPTRLNEKLRLRQKEIQELSPIRHLPSSGKPLAVFYGADELPEMIQQSCSYHAALAAHGIASDLIAVPGTNHFTILSSLFAAGGGMSRLFSRYGTR